MIGQVARWGTSGYGFIESPELPDQAWFHVRFFEKAEYLPKPGDRVEFDLHKLENGRYQARRVRLAQSLSVAKAVAVEVAPVSKPLVDRTLDGRMAKLRGDLQQEKGLLAKQAYAIRGEHDKAEEQAVAARKALTQAEGILSRAKANLDKATAQLGEFPQVQERREIGEVSAYFKQVLAEFDLALELRRQRHEDAARARVAVVAQSGEESVAEYDEIRRHSRAEPDKLVRQVFRDSEAMRREKLGEYAEALDRFDAANEIPVPLALFRDGMEEGSAALVMAVHGEADPQWRLVCLLWEVVEKAVREFGAGDDPRIERGTLGGCIAARFRAPELDTDLFQLLVDDAVAARPSLRDAGVRLFFETVKKVTPVVEKAEEEVRQPVAGEPCGGTLVDVAARTGRSLQELLAMVVDDGMEHGDDRIDAEVEKTLHILLGLSLARPDVPDSEAGPQPPLIDPSSDRGIASLLLDKLMKAKRIGGRHTGVEHVYGHGISDDLKGVAKEIQEYLTSMGILRYKLNEGADHVSIEPRRLKEVWQIIRGEWTARLR